MQRVYTLLLSLLMMCGLHFSASAADITIFYEIINNGDGTRTVSMYMRNNLTTTLNIGAVNLSVTYERANSAFQAVSFSHLRTIWNPTGTGTNEAISPENQAFLPKDYEGVSYDQRAWYIISTPASGSIPFTLAPNTAPFHLLDLTFTASNDNFYIELVSDFLGNSIVQNPPLSQYSYDTQRFSGAFPVEWLSFEAEQVAPTSAMLEWITATERHNARFDIERSMDGRLFEKIDQVQGAGNSDSPTSYQYIDYPVEAPAAWYRLRQVDLNGEFSYSETRQVTFDKQFSLAFSTYPNPVTDVLFLKSSEPDARSYDVQVLDMAGRRVHLKQGVVFTQEAVRIDVSRYPEGIYVIEVLEPQSGQRYGERFQKK
ncbi:MAG: hypothetical protein OHK0039_16780 [Bacteroidia bacterium]